jgi:type II secretory pathway component PulF
VSAWAWCAGVRDHLTSELPRQTVTVRQTAEAAAWWWLGALLIIGVATIILERWRRRSGGS